jgi:hypothetical protein
MLELLQLIPVITGVVSTTAQIVFAIHKWWQGKKDLRAQQAAYQTSQPTSRATTELQSLMGVQEQYWRSNPGVWQRLGPESAGSCLVDVS